MRMRLWCNFFALALPWMVALGGHSLGQTPETGLDAADTESAGSSAQNGAATSDDDPLRIFRAPLLREGSSLIEAVAHLQRDAAHNWWVLQVQPHDASLPPHSLMVLPCTRLTEMERIVESLPEGAVRFQVTGRVFVFRDRNYILPSHTAVVSGESAPAPTTTATAPADEPADAQVHARTTEAAPPATAPSTSPTTAPGDSAESIMRELEMQSGPIARSSGTTAATSGAGPAASPTRRSPAASSSGAPASGAGASRPSAPMLLENAAVINRRGKIARDRAGGWMLVFDADAAGLADPPMKLMPCMLLESIEDYARRVGNNSPIIMTGQVYLYNNQNYLLPTVYRIPRESTRITP